MSHRRRIFAGLALILSATALAGGWLAGIGPKIRQTTHGLSSVSTQVQHASTTGIRQPSRGRTSAPALPTLHGPIAALRAVDLAGDITEIPVLPGLDLSDPLPLPEGVYAEIEIDLNGPLTVDLPLTGGGRIHRVLDLDTLTVPLGDPDAAAEAGQVWIDASGLLGAAGADDAALSSALADGLVAG